MAHREQPLVYLSVLKNVRIKGMGNVRKGDTLAVVAEIAESLVGYGDAEILKGKALADAKSKRAPAKESAPAKS